MTSWHWGDKNGDVMYGPLEPGGEGIGTIIISPHDIPEDLEHEEVADAMQEKGGARVFNLMLDTYGLPYLEELVDDDEDEPEA